MKASDLVKEIREYCLICSSEEIRHKYSRYFREGYDAYGISQDQMDVKKRELLKRKELTLSVVLEAAPELFSTGKYEETSFVLLLMNGHTKEFTFDIFQKISGWFSMGINNWAHADMLGMIILPQFVKRSIIEPNDLREWISSPYKYQRRTVPVTLIKSLDHSARYDTLFDIITPLMNDEERVVHQGVGWFLREAWKRNARHTEPFLYKYKDTAPRLIFQYATEKMSKEQRERFRKTRRLQEG